MSPWTVAALGFGAGALVGWLALRSAERELNEKFLTGGEDLAAELEQGTALVWTKVPSAIHHEVQTEVSKELRSLGLDEGEAREWAALVRVAGGWL